MMKIVASWFLFFSICCLFTANAKEFRMMSPDGLLGITLSTEPQLSYTLSYKDKIVVAPSEISLELTDGTSWNGRGRIISSSRDSVNGVVFPVFGKNDRIKEQYNELSLSFNDGYSVVVRLYNEGFAYRFIGNSCHSDSIVVKNEIATFNLQDNPSVILPETNNYTAWELAHKHYSHISDVVEDTYGITPMLFKNSGNTIVIAESDLNDYPGLYLQKKGNRFVGHWAKYPKKIEMGSWGNFITVVKEREDYLSRNAGDHAFPWRIVMVTDDEKTLLNNNLIYLLAKPQQISDTDWIKPGKATWEWWHCAILENAPFKSGVLSTELYKYYIDFAAENGIEYLLVDAGWSNVFNHTKLNKNVDIKEIIRYGNEKNVGVWLWTVAATLFHHPHEYLDSISAWGAKGVKIDFFDRDDAEMIPQYENLAKACAERHLMVDFHGCSKPTGLHRAYPNILTYEAMRCAECAKWDTTSNPVYQLECIFTRMLGGGIDYTPGSMRNATRKSFKPVDPGLPSTLGTRSHELALYLIIDSPFAMLADSPDEYRKDPTVLKYLSNVPTVWNETVPLLARVGEYAVVAHRCNDVWYIGGINNWEQRKVSLDLSSILRADIEYSVEVYCDTNKSNKKATSYQHKTFDLKSMQLDMDMAKGGGFVLIISPSK